MAPHERQAENGRLVVECVGVVESNLRVGWRQSEVEDLTTSADDPLLWHYGPHASIYGNAPLADPGRFFLGFADLVQQRLRTGRDVAHYFDYAPFADWAHRVTQHSSFHLLTAPEPVIESCRTLLDEQQASYTVLRQSHRSGLPLQLVTIGESNVICQSARVLATPEPRRA